MREGTHRWALTDGGGNAQIGFDILAPDGQKGREVGLIYLRQIGDLTYLRQMGYVNLAQICIGTRGEDQGQKGKMGRAFLLPLF